MKRQLSEWEKMFANHISSKTLIAKTGVFPGGTSDKESTCQCRRCESCRFDPWVKKIPVGDGNPLQDSCLENSMDR